jgi:ribonucleoside-diphosphate reductase alpha chain
MKAEDRPKELQGKTYKMDTGCGKIYVTVNEHNGKPFEVFAKLGKAGGCSACQTEGLTRCISIGLRSGVELEEYQRTLDGIHCSSATFSEGEQIMSCPDAIAKVLKTYLRKDDNE